MDGLEKFEVDREEYVGFASFHEIWIVVLFFFAFEALLGDYGSIDAFDGGDELVEIADHNVAIGYIGLQLPEKSK